MPAPTLFGEPLPDGCSAAILSEDRTYQYALERRWAAAHVPTVLFVGLNPSAADETGDDLGIRRCVAYAKRWGYGGLLVGNLFAFRAAQSADIVVGDDPIGPIGPENDAWLERLSRRASMTIAAWGAHPAAQERARSVLPRLRHVRALALTKDGAPRHPLYLRADAKPFPYSEPGPR